MGDILTRSRKLEDQLVSYAKWFRLLHSERLELIIYCVQGLLKDLKSTNYSLSCLDEYFDRLVDCSIYHH